MNPFSEVGREINQCQDEIRQVKNSLYQYAQTYQLDSLKERFGYLESRMTYLEN